MKKIITRKRWADCEPITEVAEVEHDPMTVGSLIEALSKLDHGLPVVASREGECFWAWTPCVSYLLTNEWDELVSGDLVDYETNPEKGVFEVVHIETSDSTFSERRSNK